MGQRRGQTQRIRRIALSFFVATSAFPAGNPPPRVTLVHVSPNDKSIEKAMAKRAARLTKCGVRVEHVAGSNGKELEGKLRTELRPSSLVLIEGHGVTYEAGSVSEFRWVGSSVGPERLSKYAPGRGPDPLEVELSELLAKHSDELADPKTLLPLIKVKAGPAIFVDTCSAGACIDGTICVGTSCAQGEYSFNGNVVTERLTDFACSAAGDCKAFNHADTSRDGCIDGDELLATLPDREEETKEVVFTEKASDPRARARLEARLKQYARRVEFVSAKPVGVTVEVQVSSSRIKAKHKALLEDSDTKFFKARLDDEWLRAKYPWLEAFGKRNFPTKAEAEKAFAELLDKHGVRVPFTFEYDEDGERMARRINEFRVVPGEPQIEYRFRQTKTAVSYEADDLRKDTVKNNPLFQGFQFCWSACRKLALPVVAPMPRLKTESPPAKTGPH